MTTYRLQADALLRLAVMASDSPAADPDAILALLRGAETEAAEPAEPADLAMPQVAEGPDVGGTVKPAKPE